MPIPVSLLSTQQSAQPLASEVASFSAPAGPILVATRGAHRSDSVVRMAWLLAGRTGADVQVITAIESTDSTDAQLELVRGQLAGLVSGADWPITVETGRADDVITRAATRTGARLILVGRNHHSVVERAMAAGSVLRLLRHVASPVYAIDDGVTTLPHRIVVAMDFSPHAIAAARQVLAYAEPNAVVTLAHVWPRAGAITGWERTYERAIPAMFDAAIRQIPLREEIQLETVTLIGHSASGAIIDFAAASRADLIVSGAHGHGTLTRLAIGSVAADLLHHAPCSFFCVPHVQHARGSEAEPVITPPITWKSRLFQEGK